MNILVSDPFAREDRMEELCARNVELDELMRESDFISINCNVNKYTTGMVDAKMISLMKETAFIVNTARAPIMDYDALTDALEQHKIAGAALDVYPVEPLPADSRLLKLDNVVLTPHLAGQAREIMDHQAEIILGSIEALLDGKRPATILNPETLEHFSLEGK
jgi:D-3-phosphoglycerate dehydrogenase